MIKIIKVVTPILTAIVGLFTKNIFLSRSMKKAEIFKQIKKEYLEDKIIGYYYFQSFLGVSLPKNQIDFILNSEEAYSILKVIKNSNGKYTFDGKKFKSKINKLQRVFAYTGYFISSLVLMFYLLFKVTFILFLVVFSLDIHLLNKMNFPNKIISPAIALITVFLGLALLKFLLPILK